MNIIILMTTLNKNIVYESLIFPPKINTYEEYEEYLKNGIKKLFDENVELIEHFMGWNCDADLVTIVVYKKQKHYILIEIFTGTCSGCLNVFDFNELIERSIDKCYITLDKNEAEEYFKKRTSWDESHNDDDDEVCF
jgi:hypothetical protein